MRDWILINNVFVNITTVKAAVKYNGSLTLHLGLDADFDPITLTGETASKVEIILRQRSQEIFKDEPKVDVSSMKPQSFSREAQHGTT